MTECPHCHQQIEINEMHHGTLFSCPKCNAVYFVGWDGQPELPPTAEEMEAENAEAPPEEPVANTEMAFMPIENSQQETIIDNSTYQESSYESLPGNAEGEESPSYVAETDFSAGSDGHAYGSEELSANDIPQDIEVPSEVPSEVPPGEENYDFSRPLDMTAPAPEPSTADQPGFQDVTDFANSATGTGPLTYTLKIQGIDTGKIYGALKEALSDSRLGWDAQEVVKDIQNGTLEIRGLNPAKAFVVVNRIKYLSVHISWRQDVLAAT